MSKSVDVTVLGTLSKMDRIVNKTVELFASIQDFTNKIWEVRDFLEATGLDFTNQNEVIIKALFYFQNKDVPAAQSTEHANKLKKLYENLRLAFANSDSEKFESIGKKIAKLVNPEG